jgi:hypothetical protein
MGRHLHTVTDVARTDTFDKFILDSSAQGIHRAHTFRNFKCSCIMLYAKAWEHPSIVATLSIVIPVSSNQLFHPLHTCFCRISQQGDLVEHHQRLSNVLGRISISNCEPFYVANTSHHKEETFVCEYIHIYISL